MRNGKHHVQPREPRARPGPARGPSSAPCTITTVAPGDEGDPDEEDLRDHHEPEADEPGTVSRAPPADADADDQQRPSTTWCQTSSMVSQEAKKLHATSTGLLRTGCRALSGVEDAEGPEPEEEPAHPASLTRPRPASEAAAV